MIEIDESIFNSEYELHQIVNGIAPIFLIANQELDDALKPQSLWSEKALETYDNSINNLIELKNEIALWLGMAIAGVAFANDPNEFPLPIALTPDSAKKYIADQYQIELSDIDKLMREA